MPPSSKTAERSGAKAARATTPRRSPSSTSRRRSRSGRACTSAGASNIGHLLAEVIDNSIDEAMAGFCAKIDVVLEADGSATVIDAGRGVPVAVHPDSGKSALEMAFTQLHTGGKFNTDSYSTSGGLHGCGHQGHQRPLRMAGGRRAPRRGSLPPALRPRPRREPRRDPLPQDGRGRRRGRQAGRQGRDQGQRARGQGQACHGHQDLLQALLGVHGGHPLRLRQRRAPAGGGQLPHARPAADRGRQTRARGAAPHLRADRRPLGLCRPPQRGPQGHPRRPDHDLGRDGGRGEGRAGLPVSQRRRRGDPQRSSTRSPPATAAPTSPASERR